jgi:DNA-binding MarR family transcriptional regulator
MGTLRTESDASSQNDGPADGQPCWLTPDEQQAWRAHLATSKLLTRQLDRDLNQFGLSINDYEILALLSESPDQRLRMTDLADAAAQSRSRLSHQITRLEASGLVRRDTCPGDKRGLYAVLTAQGRATIERVAPHHVASVRRHFINLLTDDQLTALREGYTTVIGHLREIRERD